MEIVFCPQLNAKKSDSNCVRQHLNAPKMTVTASKLRNVKTDTYMLIDGQVCVCMSARYFSVESLYCRATDKKAQKLRRAKTDLTLDAVRFTLDRKRDFPNIGMLSVNLLTIDVWFGAKRKQEWNLI